MSDSPKKSVTWGDTAKKRFIKQHGSVDEIPEGDAHEIPKYTSPLDRPKPTDEEVKAVENALSEKISKLKNNPQDSDTQPEKKDKSFYDDWTD